MSEYVGNRIVPTHGGIWNSAKSYEPLVIVYEEGTGDSYISRKDVPAGTGLEQEDYWALCARFSEQMELYQEDVDAAVALTNSNKSTLNSRMDTLEARLDANVTASTDPDADYAAEVVDARVDDTGKTRTSLGDNIRSIGGVRTFQNILDAWTREYGYINETGSYMAGSSSSTWVCWRYIPVTGSKILVSGKFGYMSGKDEYCNIWCYDKDRNSLGGAFRAESGKDYDNEEVELLDGAAYISVSSSSSYIGTDYETRIYLMPDVRASRLLNNYASTWQGINGQIAVTFSKSAGTVDVEVLKTSTYLCRKVNGESYKQSGVTVDDSAEFEFTPSGWWAIYWEDSTDDDGNDTSGWRVESTGSNWDRLFTVDRFVLAVFYDNLVFYAAPVANGNSGYFTINGVEYGNVAGSVGTALGYSKYLSHTAYLSNYSTTTVKPGIEIDTEAGTIQITGQSLAILDNRAFLWLYADDEPYAISEGALAMIQASSPQMVIFGIEYSGTGTSKPNFYTTAEFMALGQNGYYIASLWKGLFYFPHMSTDFPFTYNGTSYKAAELFDTEDKETYVEKKYCTAFGSSTIYLASGSLEIDRENLTIQVTGRMLGCTEKYYRYVWIAAQEEPQDWILTSSPTYMSILAYDSGTESINLYDATQFAALGRGGFYIASFYQGKFYNAHMSPDVKITLDGTEYYAGALFFEDNSAYVPSNCRGAYDNDGISDIAIPKVLHCMEGRQLSCYYDSLSRFEGSENLYRFTYSTTTAGATITRNELCWNYTPGEDATDFTMTAIRLNRVTAANQETKAITVKVNHPLTKSITKNVCICGDSLVDNKYLAQEVWDMLDEDGDCVINHIGTRGGSGYEHEGRGSWKWATYLQGDDYSGKSNAFWNTDDDCLDFQWYCKQNGYDGIDYMLIALGTNDISQGSTAYSTFASLATIINNAKQFIDVLLSEDRGYPNCKVGIGLIGPGSDYSYLISSSMYTFRKSSNTLNQLYLSTFDNGAYHENVTCFSHGMMTNRKYAYPYSDKAISDRYSETSRTLTNSIHPSARGYQAWADGYYNMIRGFLTEDAES